MFSDEALLPGVFLKTLLFPYDLSCCFYCGFCQDTVPVFILAVEQIQLKAWPLVWEIDLPLQCNFFTYRS